MLDIFVISVICGLFSIPLWLSYSESVKMDEAHRLYMIARQRHALYVRLSGRLQALLRTGRLEEAERVLKVSEKVRKRHSVIVDKHSKCV